MRHASTTCISSASAKLAFLVSSLHVSFMLDISNIAPGSTVPGIGVSRSIYLTELARGGSPASKLLKLHCGRGGLDTDLPIIAAAAGMQRDVLHLT